MILPALISFAVILAIIPLADGKVQLAIVILALGIFVFSMQSILTSAAVELAGDDVHSTVTSLVYAASFIGSLSPTIAGVLADAYGLKSDVLLQRLGCGRGGLHSGDDRAVKAGQGYRLGAGAAFADWEEPPARRALASVAAQPGGFVGRENLLAGLAHPARSLGLDAHVLDVVPARYQHRVRTLRVDVTTVARTSSAAENLTEQPHLRYLPKFVRQASRAGVPSL